MRRILQRWRVAAPGLLLVAAAASLPVPAAACESEYQVEPGDTLSSIASACGTTVPALLDANRVDPSRLQLGQIIRIPAIEEAADGEAEPVAREASRKPAPAEMAAASGGYVVQPGDTPAKIARELGIPVDTLFEANDGLDPRTMQIGQVLNVPDSEEVQAILAEREAERRRLERWAEEYPDPQIALSKGDWRLTVDLEGEGFAPGEALEVSVGAEGEWITLGRMPADEEGRFATRARIPAEFAERERMHFALTRPWGDRVTSEYRHDRTETVVTTADDAPSEIVYIPPPAEGDPLEVSGETKEVASP